LTADWTKILAGKARASRQSVLHAVFHRPVSRAIIEFTAWH